MMIRRIANSNYSRIVSGFLAAVILFNNVLFPTTAMALTSGASQPEFSSFDPVGSTDMVNLFTGDFSYNIPLMDVDGYPINIAYHASPGMDQEASWVGLGWNINAGAVNRMMRGLPDDFNGDAIVEDTKIKDNKTWGVSVGSGVEFVGLAKQTGLGIGSSGSLGVYFNNYKGMGLDMEVEGSIEAMSEKAGKGLSHGMGTRFSSQDGTEISPRIGLVAELGEKGKKGSAGVNFGCVINSREGLVSKNMSINLSASKTKDCQEVFGDAPETTETDGRGFGVNLSASVPASSQARAPQIMHDMRSNAYSFDFKLGSNACVFAPFGQVKGYYVQSSLADNHAETAAFGYLNSQNGNASSLQDFSREKDGLMFPETPNMPLSNYTYDLFSAGAQGLGYAFRAQRNDIGALYDNFAYSRGNSTALGIEVLTGAGDVNIGGNFNLTFNSATSGTWAYDDGNHFSGAAGFTSSETMTAPSGEHVYEHAYFKVAGEKTPDDATFLNAILNEQPVNAVLEKLSTVRWFAKDMLKDRNGNTTAFSNQTYKSKRAVRNELVSYLSATEANAFAVSKRIENYPLCVPSLFTPQNFDDKVMQTSPTAANPGEFVSTYFSTIQRNTTFSNNKKDHLSEMTVTQSTGTRYVYGLPQYNREQNEVSFNISSSNAQSNAAAVHGLMSYNAGVDNSMSNGNGRDNYYNKRTIPDYVSSFLLTSILSSDYVDRTGNGPSNDDNGDYTKFNYSRSGDQGGYRWRFPVDKNQAAFNQGLYSDNRDNMGTYMYGKKDQWYLQSIETKNYVAFFVLNEDAVRKDAYGVLDEDGGRDNTQLSRSLQEIRLYAKKDLIHGGIAKTTPIKIVHFEYDNTLCSGAPNNGSTVGSNGKLTLKKIYFTYGNSQKGRLSPYEFEYADFDFNGTPDALANPAYDQASVDRWGNYKPNHLDPTNNLDFPYVNQTDASNDVYAAAWSLSKIKTPAGSTIKVYYEADDYGYVQDQQAAQFFPVTESGTGVNSTNGTNLYTSNYMFIDLISAKDGGIPFSSTTPDADFVNKFLHQLDRKTYFRFKVAIRPGYDEYVPGYAEFKSAGIKTTGSQPADTYTYNGQTYFRYAFVEMKMTGLNKNGGGTLVNPIVFAAFDMSRTYLPHIVFPGSEPASGNSSAVRGLISSIGEAKHLFGGINKTLYERKVATTFTAGLSAFRLFTPGKNKIGGGSRVSKITVSDGWNAMSGEAESEYGTEYDYTMTEAGQIISSGVASYEPILGGDENTMHYPVEFGIKKTFAANDEYYQEEPFGESLFPDPLVGYRKVTVKNLGRQNVKRHATGRTEYEFYTAKDYPVVTERTDLDKQRIKPKLIINLLRFGSLDKLYNSQGYLVKTNDMHGKPKSQKMFAEDQVAAISGMTYYYKSKQGAKCRELDNRVNVVDENNNITQATIGQVTDLVTDSRSSKSRMYSFGGAINVTASACMSWIPYAVFIPSFAWDKTQYFGVSTTKTIQQYGLIDYVEAFDNHSVVQTKNVLYDAQTGEVVLSQTQNDFDQPVYNFGYPAHWMYRGMDAGYKNTGIFMPPSLLTSAGQITSSYVKPGDEIAIINSQTPSLSKRAWVVEDEVGAQGKLYLVNEQGALITNSGMTNANTVLKIVRSGSRNLQSVPVGELVTLQNPINTTTNKLDITTSTGIIDASATEFSDRWQMHGGDDKVVDGSCTCTMANGGERISAALQYLVGLWYTKPTALVNYNISCPAVNAGSYTGYCESSVNTFINASGLSHLLTISTATGSVAPYSLNYFFGNGSGCTLRLDMPSTSDRWDLYASFVSVSNFQIFAGDCDKDHYFTFNVTLRDRNNQVVTKTITGYTDCFPVATCTNSGTVTQCGLKAGATVNPYFEGIRGNWRAKKTYAYLTERQQSSAGTANMKGDIQHDGTFVTFKPFWQYNTTAQKWLAVYDPARTDYVSLTPYDKWIRSAEARKVNPYGNALESSDALDLKSASLYGFNHTLPVAAASNAYYNQIAYDGFEDYDYLRSECSSVLTGTASQVTNGYMEHFNFYKDRARLNDNMSHTGRYSLALAGQTTLTVQRKLAAPSVAFVSDNVPYTLKDKDFTGCFAPFYGYPTGQKYVLSFWVRELNSPSAIAYPDAKATVAVNGAILSATLTTSPIINNWQKFDYVFTVPANSANTSPYGAFGTIDVSVMNTSATSTSYVDDIRIHPFNSGMKTICYDPRSLRVMAEMDERNFATYYEYDEEGTLVRVKKETERGIYTLKESRSGLKK